MTKARKLFLEFDLYGGGMLALPSKIEIPGPDVEELRRNFFEEDRKMLKKFQREKKIPKYVKKLGRRLNENSEKLSKIKPVASRVEKVVERQDELRSDLREMKQEYRVKIEELGRIKKYLKRYKGVVPKSKNLEEEREFLKKEITFEDVILKDKRSAIGRKKRIRNFFKKIFKSVFKKDRDAIEPPGF